MAARTCPDCHTEIPDRDPAVSFCPTCGCDVVSVRPPDLAADDLPADDVDPLDGWDDGPPPLVEEQVPTPLVVVAAAGVGLVAGSALAGHGRRGRGGATGALAGLCIGLVARRAWELPAPDDTWASSLQG